MNRNILIMYVLVLKHGGEARVERIKDGVYGIDLYKERPGNWYAGTKPWKSWNQRKFFYLYPRNKYTGESS